MFGFFLSSLKSSSCSISPPEFNHSLLWLYRGNHPLSFQCIPFSILTPAVFQSNWDFQSIDSFYLIHWMCLFLSLCLNSIDIQCKIHSFSWILTNLSWSFLSYSFNETTIQAESNSQPISCLHLQAAKSDWGKTYNHATDSTLSSGPQTRKVDP